MPPRLPPLPPAEWPAEMKAALAALRPASAPSPGQREEGRPKGLNVLGTFARYPELAKAFFTFNRHVLYASSISDRQRELLILRVAALRGSEYEWAQHVLLATDAGLTPEQIAAVAEGPESAGWAPPDRALLRAADELIADAVVSDATWDDLARGLDDRQLMDVVFTVGAYELVAMAFRSFGLELDADLRPQQ